MGGLPAVLRRTVSVHRLATLDADRTGLEVERPLRLSTLRRAAWYLNRRMDGRQVSRDESEDR